MADRQTTEEEQEVIVRVPEAGAALLTVEEVSELLGVPEQTLLDWAAVSEGPPFYSWARTPFYRREEVLLWMMDQPEPPVSILIEGRRVRRP